jgi:hypothetical protein
LGTALVPFDDQDHWEAWHQLQHKKATERQAIIYNRYEVWPSRLKRWAVVPALLAAAMFFYARSHQLDANSELGLAVVLLLIVVLTVFATFSFFDPHRIISTYEFGFSTHVKKSITSIITVEYPLNFTCPSCHQRVNLAAPWICGYCRYEHDAWMNGPLFLGCVNADCYVAGRPIEPSQKHRAATAYQCPCCADHILINPKLYQHAGGHTKPHKGVARFIGDTQQPKIDGRLSEKEMTVGDLINQAIDRVI